MRGILEEAAHLVYNQLGYGLSESCYRRALVAELKSRPQIESVQEEYGLPLFITTSNGQRIQISVLRADIICTHNNRLIVIELKTVTKELSNQSKEFIQVARYSDILQAHEKFLINFSNNGIQLIE